MFLGIQIMIEFSLISDQKHDIQLFLVNSKLLEKFLERTRNDGLPLSYTILDYLSWLPLASVLAEFLSAFLYNL